jgi:hypothetical protein
MVEQPSSIPDDSKVQIARLTRATLQQPSHSYRSGANPSLMSMLSVMTLTLAFFVVLNSISRVEDQRSKRVMASVEATFGFGETTRTGDVAKAIAATDRARMLGVVFESIRSLMPENANVSRPLAEQLEIRFPTAWVFPTASVRPSATAIQLFGEMRRVLSAQGAEASFELDLTLASPDLGDGDFDRAENLAALFAETQHPAERATVGIVVAQEAAIVIAIRLGALAAVADDRGMDQ